MEDSSISGRQIVRASDYAYFNFKANENQDDLTIQFNMQVWETGKDISFVFLEYEEFKKWYNWFYHQTITKKDGTVERVPQPELKVLYRFRSNILKESFHIGKDTYTLLLDNSYSAITDKTVYYTINIRWDVQTPSNGLPLMKKEVIELPPELHDVIKKANDSYLSGHFDQCNIMLRKAIEFAIRLKLLQSGIKDSEIMNEHGYEIPLAKKIKLLVENNLITSKTAKMLDEIKWYGDMSAHNNAKFVLEDIRDSVEPKIRTFLIGLQLRL